MAATLALTPRDHTLDELSRALETVLDLLKDEEPLAVELEHADNELVSLVYEVVRAESERPWARRKIDRGGDLDMEIADQLLLALAASVEAEPPLPCPQRRMARRRRR